MGKARRGTGWPSVAGDRTRQCASSVTAPRASTPLDMRSTARCVSIEFAILPAYEKISGPDPSIDESVCRELAAMARSRAERHESGKESAGEVERNREHHLEAGGSFAGWKHA